MIGTVLLSFEGEEKMSPLVLRSDYYPSGSRLDVVLLFVDSKIFSLGVASKPVIILSLLNFLA